MTLSLEQINETARQSGCHMVVCWCYGIENFIEGKRGGNISEIIELMNDAEKSELVKLLIQVAERYARKAERRKFEPEGLQIGLYNKHPDAADDPYFPGIVNFVYRKENKITSIEVENKTTGKTLILKTSNKPSWDADKVAFLGNEDGCLFVSDDDNIATILSIYSPSWADTNRERIQKAKNK